MKLKCVYVRFYKSFNFDHLRKIHPEVIPKPWETMDEEFFPYIRVSIDREITTVVGANESGKTHLLSAIEKAIKGDDFDPRDLCRYSPRFSVEQGKECWPHLGLEWNELTENDLETIREAVPKAPKTFPYFAMFRTGPGDLTLYFPSENDKLEPIKLDEGQNKKLTALLPEPFKINPKIALPNSVPIAWLADPTSGNLALTSPRYRANLLQAGLATTQHWNKDANKFQSSAPELFKQLTPYLSEHAKLIQEFDKNLEDSLHLARNMLIKIANVAPERLQELADAIAEGADGHAKALVTRINDQLTKKLNFPKWWVQDRDFSLCVTPRDVDLVFTIQDRTGTEYTFGERSSGLKYFLSYFIQSQSHDRSRDRSEILLMDEPDAFLSAEAQQDLLKIFDAFAQGTPEWAANQVVFVTHSPFLIDKNNAKRIRVLEKGKGQDGTRAITNPTRNHYEPLRSAFGAFVGETAFVGSSNLLIEGVADQVLLAGAARALRVQKGVPESETLDLNRLVLVPCGSTNHVPYMVYLIRGRDTDKPPVIVLLDSDKSGNDAAKDIKTDAKMQKLIDSKYVVQLGDIPLFENEQFQGVELEDIVPSRLAVAAANEYLAEVNEFRSIADKKITDEEFSGHLAQSKHVYDALNAAAGTRGLHLEKLGLARAISKLCEEKADDTSLQEAIGLFLKRMRKVFSALNEQRVAAERENLAEKVTARVKREYEKFVRDHPTAATREQALQCLKDIEVVLNGSAESDEIRTQLNAMKRDFKLDESLADAVGKFPSFKAKLEGLKDAFKVQQITP